MRPVPARALCLAGFAALCAAVATGAAADVSRCSDQKVEYLIGGSAKGAAAGRTCASGVTAAISAAPVHRPAAAGEPRSGPGPFMKPDDAGRRDILQQELQTVRAALAELDRTHVPTPGAGSVEAERTRRLADITALESELRRTPGP